MNPTFNLRYWLFASRSAACRGGLDDLVASYPTLPLCIQQLLGMGINPDLGGWWQIYDVQTGFRMCSRQPFDNGHKIEQKNLENLE